MAVNKVSGLNFTSGPISFSELRKVFVENTTNPISFSSVYRTTDANVEDPIVPNASENINVPTSGTIDASDFRNTIKAIEVHQTDTNENLNINDHLSLFGDTNLTSNVRKNFRIKGTVASKDNTKSALSLTTSTQLKNVAIVNDGNIYGAAGKGGTSTSSATKGGDAIYVRSYVKLINNGNIWAGGGGGGLGGDGSKGGDGGKGVFYTFMPQTCYNNITYTYNTFVAKTCYTQASFTYYKSITYTSTTYSYFTCYTSGTFSLSYYAAKTCYYKDTVYKDSGKPSLWAMVTGTCDKKGDTCFKYESYSALCGFKDGRYQCKLQACFKCGQTDQVTKQYECGSTATTQVAYQQANQCLKTNTFYPTFQQANTQYYQQAYNCDFQQSNQGTYQQSYDCSYYTTTYTAGGLGGSKGSGGSGGSGRGYDFNTPNSLAGNSGGSPGKGADGGTNAGKGADGTTGSTGGSGGDWGSSGLDGGTSTLASKGGDGNFTTGLDAGSVGSPGKGGKSGNAIDGKSYLTITNNNSIKGEQI